MSKNNGFYDVVILATKKNLITLKKMVPLCKTNIASKQIYVVANSCIKEEIDSITDVKFIDESTIYEGMNFNTVTDIIEKIGYERKNGGWYLQQFLKMAWAYRCQEECYIVFDADTFPLNKIEFMSDEGNYLFTKKVEYNKPYFDTINRLFDGQVKRVGNFSFVAENMIFDCCYMKEMISKIEVNENLTGNNFYEKILHAISPSDILKSGFSEFETYGNYIFTFHPERAELRLLRTQREAVYYLGSNPTSEQLLWAKQDFDIISIEVSDYKTTFMTWLTGSSIVRKCVPLHMLTRWRSKLRSIYRKIIGKKDFKFENN